MGASQIITETILTDDLCLWSNVCGKQIHITRLGSSENCDTSRNTNDTGLRTLQNFYHPV